MPVVGTAGHVDHGKSTLVHALTGRDPDRWEEEKRRGLTIDLGFAWTVLGDGTEVSFVDVPGHERFIKNMLAGSEAIDIALFVVAADEAWMPQSEEHLAVLHLLGVSHGVVAVTKIDRVDDELVDLVIMEVEEKVAGTSLAGSPVFPVSAVTGRGVKELKEGLERAVAAASPHLVDIGRPRLWIDRSFTISGAGTVVTGTLLDGGLDVGDQVEIWPGERRARVRGLQSHEVDRISMEPHNRVAVNLAGLERTDVRRGDMLGRPNDWAPTRVVMAEIETARYLDVPLTDKGAYHLHLGSGAWPIGLRLLGAPEVHTSGVAFLNLPSPLPLMMGDRFIIREVGRRAVVAGGRVLDPHPLPARSARSFAVPLRGSLAGSADDRAAALLQARGRDHLDRLAADSGGGTPRNAAIAGTLALDPAATAELTGLAAEIVSSFHTDNPLRAGIPKASLASRLGVEPAVVDVLVARSRDLRDDGATVAVREFGGAMTPAQQSAWESLRSALAAAGPSVPRLKELGVDPELVHALVRAGKLVRISDDLAYLPDQIEDIIRRLRTLPAPFTVADFRDALDISRKYAVPLLEYLDAERVTLRKGDLRTLRS